MAYFLSLKEENHSNQLLYEAIDYLYNESVWLNADEKRFLASPLLGRIYVFWCLSKDLTSLFDFFSFGNFRLIWPKLTD